MEIINKTVAIYNINEERANEAGAIHNAIIKKNIDKNKNNLKFVKGKKNDKNDPDADDVALNNGVNNFKKL